jgi:hypothetical protein
MTITHTHTITHTQKYTQVGEERQVQGNTVHILERPGWVFGDLALLFHLVSLRLRTRAPTHFTDTNACTVYVCFHLSSLRLHTFCKDGHGRVRRICMVPLCEFATAHFLRTRAHAQYVYGA